MESIVVIDYDCKLDSIGVQITRIPISTIDKIVQYKYIDTFDGQQIRREIYRLTHKTDFSVDGSECRVFLKDSNKVYTTFKSEVEHNNLQDLYYIETTYNS